MNDDDLVGSLDAGALDDLNLDDMMFGEGGDDLFGGLDMDLNDMGDLPKQQQQQQNDPPSPTRQRRGPETQRPPTPPPPPPVEPTTARRKTKRKSKAPPAWDSDDEDAAEAHSNSDAVDNSARTKKKKKAKHPSTAKADRPKSKKKRTAKSGTTTPPSKASTAANTTAVRRTKKKPARADLSTPSVASSVDPSATTTAKTKSKKGKKKSSVGSSASRNAPAATVSVPTARKTGTAKGAKKKKSAAAAAVGSSVQDPRHKRTSSLSGDTSSVASNLSSFTAEAALSAAKPTTTTPHGSNFPPKQEPTYCGLHKSDTLFYPFLPAVPSEATMKTRKGYPSLDKVTVGLTSAINSAGQSDTAPVPVESSVADSPIFKLLVETYELTDRDKAAFGPEKRQQLQRSIQQLRGTIQKLDKAKLVSDLFALCQLLQRQHDFLQRNLDNMQNWCKRNFSPLDYQLTYHAENFDPRGGSGAGAAAGSSSSSSSAKNSSTVITSAKLRRSSTGHVVSPNFLSMRTPFLRIRISCSGFQSSVSPLVAQLPPDILDLIGPEKEREQAEKAAAEEKAKLAAAKAAASKAAKKSSSKAAVKSKQSGTTGRAKTTAPATATDKPKPATSTQQSIKVTAATVIAATTKTATVRTKPVPVKLSARERRQQIWEFVNARALQMESKYLTSCEARLRAIEYKSESAAKVVEEAAGDNDDDDSESLYTKTAWRFLEAGGYLDRDFNLTEVDHILQSFWSVLVAGSQEQRIRHLPIVMGRKKKEEMDEQAMTPTSLSLVDRLQSLLVEEDDENDNYSKSSPGAQLTDDEDSDDSDDEIDIMCADGSDNDADSLLDTCRRGTMIDDNWKLDDRLVDLSQLSMEERLFVYMKSIGLVKQNVCPETKLHSREGDVPPTWETLDALSVGGGTREELGAMVNVSASAGNGIGGSTALAAAKADSEGVLADSDYLMQVDEDRRMKELSNGTIGSNSDGKPEKLAGGRIGQELGRRKVTMVLPEEKGAERSNGKSGREVMPSSVPSMSVPDTSVSGRTVGLSNGRKGRLRPKIELSHEDSIDDVLSEMAEDLDTTSRLNNIRLQFLQKSAREHWRKCEEYKAQHVQDLAALEKCKTMMQKRSKEQPGEEGSSDV